MCPRDRNAENQELPDGCRYKGAPDSLGRRAITYQVPRGQRHLFDDQSEYTLARTPVEAAKALRLRLGARIAKATPKTLFALFNRYLGDITPTKAPKTQKSDRYYLNLLKQHMADTVVDKIRPRHCFAMRDQVCDERTVQVANRALATLSAVMTVAIEWGCIDEHPIKQKVGKLPVTWRRERVKLKTPSLLEIDQALETATPMLVAYVGVKLVTALRRTDILRMTWSMWDTARQELNLTPRKTAQTTGRELTFGPYQDLTDAMNNARRLTPLSPYVIHSTTGKCYLDDEMEAKGFESAWERWMIRVNKAGHRTFSERYIRNRVATNQGSIIEAAHLLGIDPRVVWRHYSIGGNHITGIKK